MNYKRILVTGGAGFIGSNICIKLKENYPQVQVIALDNLIRKGSELNLPRLRKHGVLFVKGDVRFERDLEIGKIECIIECSADPSVMAGITSLPRYVIDTNLVGAINCFELARKKNADIIFLSTSRVYPQDLLNKLSYKENDRRFMLQGKQKIEGASKNGVAESFSTNGHKTFYGATKLSAELLLQEYIVHYGIKGIINRLSVVAGPWQMGKIDQGIVAYWMLQHVFKKTLKYIGFGGKGKQVRDILDIEDVFFLIDYQLNHINQCNGKTYNAGGGLKNSISLKELTNYCQKLTRNKLAVQEVLENRIGDVRIYITDNTKVTLETGWAPKKSLNKILEDVYGWILTNKDNLAKISS